MPFDAAGRIDQVAQGSRVDTTAFSGTTGWATSFTDALGRVTSIDARDAAGRVLAQTLPGARVVSMTYDRNGNTTSITPPGQPAHAMDYTALDLESRYTPPAVPGASGVVESVFDFDRMLIETRRAEGSIVYGYDAFGRRASTVDPLFSALFGYNAADQLVSLTGSDGVDLTFVWDGDLLRRTNWSGLVAGTVEKRYDHLLRLKEQVTMGQSVQTAYDADDLPVQVGPVAIGRDPANGRVVSTTVGGVTETYTYNAFGELEAQEAKHGGAPLLRRDYARDALGRITSVTESVLGGAPAITSYTYDAAGRLDSVTTGASAVTYTYDPNGNRTHVSGVPVATYDAQDRLLTYAGANYTYTAGGDLRTKTDASGTTTYTYDLQGNLKRVDLPTGDVVEYVVDPQSRRVARKLNGAFTHKWLYEDQLRPVAELDGAGNLVSLFVYSAPTPGGPRRHRPRRRHLPGGEGSPRLAAGGRERGHRRRRPAHGLRRLGQRPPGHEPRLAALRLRGRSLRPRHQAHTLRRPRLRRRGRQVAREGPDSVPRRWVQLAWCHGAGPCECA